MRTIVDLPENQLEALSAVCDKEKISRAEAIRRALAKYLHAAKPDDRASAFGLWKGRKLNAFKYEDKLRAEWERP